MTPRSGLGVGEGVVSEKSEEKAREGERESTFQTGHGHGGLELRHLLQVCRVSLLLFVHQSF